MTRIVSNDISNRGRYARIGGDNPTGRGEGRRVTLEANTRTLLYENTSDNDVSWTVYLNTVQENGISIEIDIELLGVGYNTSADVVFTIAGADDQTDGSGDYYTGTGACRVFATSELANEISIMFVRELQSPILPPMGDNFDIIPLGGTANKGYPPFGRYFCSLYSNADFTLYFDDDQGNQLFTQVMNQANDKDFLQRFMHPPNTRLRIIGTIANQIFCLTHYQLRG
mgnify:CR=1 FL=1|tara:strand:- start:7361 stop:8041 length:681 start_codon:yes stop_codon:yes gene_type:complete